VIPYVIEEEEQGSENFNLPWINLVLSRCQRVAASGVFAWADDTLVAGSGGTCLTEEKLAKIRVEISGFRYERRLA